MFTTRFRPRTLLSLLATGALAVTMACGGGDDDDPTGPEANAIASVISALRSGDGSIAAQLRTGAPPSGGNGATVTITVPNNLIQGGSAQIPVTSAVAFSRILVALQNFNGYYELTLPSAVTSSSFLISVEPNATAGARTLRVAAGSASSVGAYTEEAVTVLDVGTGELQVSASWDAPSDVDLHVVTPGGEEIYYGNDVANGGTLDLDSNPGCSIDNINNENITWSATPPSGSYIVRLDYYDSCGVSATNWVVTVRRGSNVQTFTGRFTGGGDGGGEGDGQTITTFTR